jgi:hypothetical protein
MAATQSVNEPVSCRAGTAHQALQEAARPAWIPLHPRGRNLVGRAHPTRVRLASRARSRRWRLLTRSGLIVVLLTSLTPAPCQAQELRAAAPNGDAPTPLIFGERYCAQCHAHPENYKAESVICRMNEATIWEAKDKHKNAFAVLSDPRGVQMGKILGIDVTASRSCLGCHSVTDRSPVGARQGGEVAPRPMRAQQFDRKGDGVSCVACHGAFREWAFEHTAFEDPKWRSLSRKEKEVKYGMVDLWDPVTRTKRCLSCHVGNYDEGNVLTHAMYAAGHPPLPGIEISTFSESMPDHWEYLGEKRQGRRPEVRKALEAMLDLDKLEHTELVAVSGLVPLRESLRLFAAQAEKDELGDIPGSRWPDFARFDCYACHHEVNRPNWRQTRGFPGVPGRPPAPSWPLALVALGIEAANPQRVSPRLEQFDRQIKEFHAALSARPFGNKDQAIASARTLVGWVDEVLGDLGKAPVDRDLAIRLLDRVCRLSRSDVPDYDTARQLFWAFRTIYNEIEPKAGPDSLVVKLLRRTDEELGFSLPSAGTQEPIEATLARRLKAVTNYDPATFQARFAELTALLPRR